MSVENNDMMAGSDIYRRVQTRKTSAMRYVVPAVVVIAIGAGAALYALQPSSRPALPAPSTVASVQQAQGAAQQATTSAGTADTAAKSAIAANDQAQANVVAATGNPPASTTDTGRTPAAASTHHPIRSADRTPIRVRPDRAASAGAAAADVNAMSTPPAPVLATPTQPAPIAPPAASIPSTTTPQLQPATPDQSTTPSGAQP